MPLYLGKNFHEWSKIYEICETSPSKVCHYKYNVMYVSTTADDLPVD